MISYLHKININKYNIIHILHEMSNFQYMIQDLENPCSKIITGYILNVHSTNVNNVNNEIIERLLENVRQSRFNSLMSNYKGDINDIDNLKEYLPSRYQDYAYNLNILNDHMATFSEIASKYDISNIQPAPSCHGCLFNRPGQDDHLDCDTGCLHFSPMCTRCS